MINFLLFFVCLVTLGGILYTLLMACSIVAKSILGIPEDTKFGNVYDLVFEMYSQKMNDILLELFKDPKTDGEQITYLRNAIEAHHKSYNLDLKKMQLDIIWSEESGRHQYTYTLDLRNFKIKTKIRFFALSFSAAYLFWLVRDKRSKQPSITK